jgi:hypothetical protein
VPKAGHHLSTEGDALRFRGAPSHLVGIFKPASAPLPLPHYLTAMSDVRRAKTGKEFASALPHTRVIRPLLNIVCAVDFLMSGVAAVRSSWHTTTETH